MQHPRLPVSPWTTDRQRYSWRCARSSSSTSSSSSGSSASRCSSSWSTRRLTIAAARTTAARYFAGNCSWRCSVETSAWRRGSSSSWRRCNSARTTVASASTRSPTPASASTAVPSLPRCLWSEKERWARLEGFDWLLKHEIGWGSLV